MSSIRIKICGLRNKHNIQDVLGVEPDYLGFIFYRQSPRYVGEDFVLSDTLNPGINRVGVFVNETTETIMEMVMKHRLNFVQLHGEETPQQCKTIKKKAIRVIKAFAVDDDFDFKITIPYEAHVDYFLFDTKGIARGGNGVTFNWDLLKNYNGSQPFFLSGGINPENVGDIRQLDHERLFGIDINSGVESAPGMKDVEKLNELIKRIK